MANTRLIFPTPEAAKQTVEQAISDLRTSGFGMTETPPNSQRYTITHPESDGPVATLTVKNRDEAGEISVSGTNTKTSAVVTEVTDIARNYGGKPAPRGAVLVP